MNTRNEPRADVVVQGSSPGVDGATPSTEPILRIISRTVGSTCF